MIESEKIKIDIEQIKKQLEDAYGLTPPRSPELCSQRLRVNTFDSDETCEIKQSLSKYYGFECEESPNRKK